MSGRIAVFIPTYNEVETLSGVVAQIPKSIMHREVEVFIVDDASTDGTTDIARKLTPNFIAMERNSGVGVVTKCGLEMISSREDIELVLKMDGDGQHQVHFLGQMVEQLIAGKDVVVCSRFHPCSDQANTPIDRILLNTMFTDIVRKITGWELTDARSGYMGFRFEDIKRIASSLIVQRYGIPMELLLRIWSIKPLASVCEFPHPAIYGKGVSEKLDEKYATEVLSDKANRVTQAYEALLSVVIDIDIPRERILEAYGFTQALAA